MQTKKVLSTWTEQGQRLWQVKLTAIHSFRAFLVNMPRRAPCRVIGSHKSLVMLIKQDLCRGRTNQAVSSSLCSIRQSRRGPNQPSLCKVRLSMRRKFKGHLESSWRHRIDPLTSLPLCLAGHPHPSRHATVRGSE